MSTLHKCNTLTSYIALLKISRGFDSPICFSAALSVEPSTINIGLRPRPFSAYRFKVSVVLGDKLSMKNVGVEAEMLVTRVPELPFITSKINNAD